MKMTTEILVYTVLADFVDVNKTKLVGVVGTEAEAESLENATATLLADFGAELRTKEWVITTSLPDGIVTESFEKLAVWLFGIAQEDGFDCMTRLLSRLCTQEGWDDYQDYAEAYSDMSDSQKFYLIQTIGQLMARNN